MALDFETERSILDWDENQVHLWFSSLGLPQYEAQIREHNISGDILCTLDAENLKNIGISTIGQRLTILKAIYQVKLQHHVPFDADHYVPPSEAQDQIVSADKLFDVVKEHNHRVKFLEEDNRRLNETLQLVLDELNTLRSQPSHRPNDHPLRHQGSFKWENSSNHTSKSPTKSETNGDSPQNSPARVHNTDPSSSVQQPSATKRPEPSRNDSYGTGTDNMKSFKVSLEDPTWKVLPAALKKYKINNDSWQNYAMFICYGSPGNRIERCLSYDEKPLLLFQKLKDAKKNPVFMLKHIKDIRSPIAVAQQKHAMRKASIGAEGSSGAGPSGSGSGSSSQAISPNPGAPSSATLRPNQAPRPTLRPPRLEVNDLSSAGSQPMTGTNPQAGWPEVMSPSVEKKENDHLRDTIQSSTSTLIEHGSEEGSGRASGTHSSTSTLVNSNNHASTSSSREMPPRMDGVSYAVAIYPYMAEQDDEFDVVVGDTFVILSRARGWWVVQRDPTGSGAVDPDTSNQGWVPAGCLLETNVPVASAIAEAKASLGGATTPPAGESSDGTKSVTPILPLSIISTSYPGIALMDYQKKGEEELDLAKDDALRVFKRYNHWSYAVKEDGGDRGWVPSWFIGKVPAPGAVPPTPIAQASTNPTINVESADSTPQNQVSPMSSAFPVANRGAVLSGSAEQR
ncbi:hypothetical protein CONPUDRAFT_127146 [Coniophora puteana RWD-64-598 SS2]|uniref:RA-domain-containing protein n=1 Tax=Coniophora puteana (strain RWD-64-598) TaxID=741705 RepID=A0A5M3MK81_CONPW|nr:uncharacterized protein CONPUDRAFT_127146 [Coniophora puteana RWD-64-598 SS2]EIW79224.1 hypothetical protein CONPUDRAFT_127146 [Coniophora puteana RWD-64-598 SS2]